MITAIIPSSQRPRPGKRKKPARAPPPPPPLPPLLSSHAVFLLPLLVLLLVPLLSTTIHVQAFLLRPPPLRCSTCISPSSLSSSRCRPATTTGPGYINTNNNNDNNNNNKNIKTASRPRRGAARGRSIGGPPPPPPPRSASQAGGALVSTSSSTSGNKEEWVQAFEHLQGLMVRKFSDYEGAFATCHASRRPFECLSLLRYMVKDELPRKAEWYEATARLAAGMENWVTVLDTYLMFEKKEQFVPTCPFTRKLIELTLQATERLGKGSRAVRVYEKATQILQPPLAEIPAAVLVLRACFRAAAYDLGLPFARFLLEKSKDTDEQQQQSLQMDLPTVNIALSTLSKSRCGLEAAAALTHMREEWNLAPDVVSYGAVIEGLATAAQEGGDLEEALALLHRMTQVDKLRPNVVILNMLVQACCKAGRLEEAWELFQTIPVQERGDAHRTQSLWSLATREGNLVVIQGLLQELQQQQQQQQQTQTQTSSRATSSSNNNNNAMSLSCYHASLCNMARLGLYEPAEQLAELVSKTRRPRFTPISNTNPNNSNNTNKGKDKDEITAPIIIMTDMTYYALIAACEKAGQHARLLGWFQEMLRAQVEPDALRYGMALKACEVLGKWQAGLALMLRMRDRGLVMDPLLWKRLFLLLGREARGQEALDLLQEMETRGRGGGDGEEDGGSTQNNNKNKTPPLRLEPICYEATVTALSRMGDKERAVRQLILFEEEKKVHMGRGAYTSAIASCRDSKDAKLALLLYHRMKTRGNEAPSTVTRAALLDVLVAAAAAAGGSNNNNHKLNIAAEKVVAAAGEVALEQEQSGETVPAHMLGNMVMALSMQQQDFEKVLSYFRLLWKNRPDPALPVPWVLCNVALQACARVGDYELALEILRTMQGAEVPVDVVMYGCVLTACSVAGKWKEAFRLLKEMEVNAAVAAAEAEVARKRQQQQQQQQQQVAARGGADVEGEEQEQEQEESGGAKSAATGQSAVVKPNLVCYTSVITALQHAQEWRKALHLLVKMLNTGPTPDVHVYNAVLSACANSGETHMALKTFQAMKSQGVSPDDVTYATAIVACWRGDDWRQALEILQAMKVDGYKPNMISVTLVIDALDKQRKFDLAAHVFETSFVGYVRSEDYEMGQEGPGMLVDLHGYSQPVARAAIRAGLKRLSQMYSANGKDEKMIKDFVFITGIGRNSELPFEPVLRPAMQKMLTEDFNPPLPCETVEKNAGRMVVRAADLVQWLNAQSSSKSKSPAELHSGTLKLRTAEQLETSYQDFKGGREKLAEFLSEAEAVVGGIATEMEG